MDARSEEPGHKEVQGEVGLGPREFHFLQGVTKDRGIYRVSIVYQYGDDFYETFTDGLYEDIEMARSVREAILRGSIETSDHGFIPIKDLVEIRIQKKQVAGDDDE